MVVTAPKIILNNGYTIPAFGLGTYAATGTTGEQAVKDAIDAGYRHIDTAALYNTEDEVGRAIRDKITEGVITREDIFVVTKLWSHQHAEEKVVPACRKSLENLGLDYIDLYLVHAPVGFEYQGDDVLLPKDKDGNFAFSDVDYIETWRAMEQCVKLGLCRSIGISNFNSEQIERVLKVAEIKPVNNQVECSPHLNQKKLIEFCKSKEITVTAYSPLGRPDFEKRTPDYFFDERVAEIGRKYKKKPAQVILRYIYELGAIPIPKSVTKSRIGSNIDIFDFQLNSEELAYMDSLNTNKRLIPFEMAVDHKYYPFAIEF